MSDNAFGFFMGSLITAVLFATGIGIYNCGAQITCERPQLCVQYAK